MSWVTLSSAHVLARLTTDEHESFEAVGEAASTEKLAGIIEQVTGLVRSKVATCSRNTLGAAGMIPESCLFHAVSLVRAALIASQPTSNGSTDERDKETEAANKFLDQVAACDVAIEDAEGSFPSATADAVDSWGSKCLLDF